MNHHLLLVIHLLSAALWVGGHLYLTLGILPQVLRKRNPGALLHFEKSYEPFGLTALLLLVVTGIWMTLQFGISSRQWFSFSSPVERVTSTKLLLLLATIVFAISAKTRVIPRLRANPGRLPEMAIHIIGVTLLGIAMLVLGSFVRYGGFK